MKAETLARLNEINQEFYQTFAGSFSQTRQRIQPGVARILSEIPRTGDFLDIGCGNGNLAHHWARQGFSGSFIGVDFSPDLIAAARETVTGNIASQTIVFLSADLSRIDWASVLPQLPWRALFCFAVLHHIPGSSQRLRLCQQMRALTPPAASVWVSVWQPLNSPRLKKRILGWETVGLGSADVEPGDVLMDWRAHQENAAHAACRYVHIFNESELTALAENAGFCLKESYYSDGKEGNLGLYQRWMPED